MVIARAALALAMFGLFAGPVPAAGPEREDRPPLDPASIPAAGAAVAGFVPPGWRIEAETAGDLDRDAVADTVLTLVEDLPVQDGDGSATDRHRALVVLLRRDGGFVRAGGNGRLLLCTRCGGAFFGVAETPANVSIERGQVIVRQEWGAREMTAETFRFRYDPKARRMQLIGQDVRHVDRLGPILVEDSTNLLTGDVIRTESRFDEATQKEKSSTTRTKVARTTVYLEDVRSLGSP